MNSHVMLGAIAVFGLAVGSTANADDTGSDAGLYIGAGLGQSKIGVDDLDFNESDTAYKLFVGYSFNPHFALEGSYFDSGSPTKSYGNASVDTGSSGLNFSAVGRIPIGESFALFAKLGFASYDFEANARINGNTIYSASGSDSDMTYGFGMSVTLGQKFVLAAEYEVIDIPDMSFDMMMVTGAVKF